MSDKTGIDWTDATWNPIRGCSRVSEGCRNCYAERVANRFSVPGQPYAGTVTDKGVWNGNIFFIRKHLMDPLSWREPRRIFVNSMSDLFHENAEPEWVEQIFAVMYLARRHTFQVLTKRPERMRDFLTLGGTCVRITRAVFDVLKFRGQFDKRRTLAPELFDAYGEATKEITWPLPNVWLGVSIEDQKTADARLPILLRTPAALRFVSYEPALGPVALARWMPTDGWFLTECEKCGWIGSTEEVGEARNYDDADCVCPGCGKLFLCNEIKERIGWVICGGESDGARPHPENAARPMHPAWARSVRDQCQAAGVPFFFKQWGEFMPSNRTVPHWVHGEPKDDYVPWQRVEGETVFNHVGKKSAGRLLDGREWNEFPKAVQTIALIACMLLGLAGCGRDEKTRAQRMTEDHYFTVEEKALLDVGLRPVSGSRFTVPSSTAKPELPPLPSERPAPARPRCEPGKG